MGGMAGVWLLLAIYAVAEKPVLSNTGLFSTERWYCMREVDLLTLACLERSDCVLLEATGPVIFLELFC